MDPFDPTAIDPARLEQPATFIGGPLDGQSQIVDIHETTFDHDTPSGPAHYIRRVELTGYFFVIEGMSETDALARITADLSPRR